MWYVLRISVLESYLFRSSDMEVRVLSLSVLCILGTSDPLVELFL